MAEFIPYLPDSLENLVSEKMNRKVISILPAEVMNDAGGLSGASMIKVIAKIQIENSEEIESISMIQKSVKSDMSKNLGLPREALFYDQYKSVIDSSVEKSFLPGIYYSYGDMDNGEKLILMEDLNACTQTGHFFGPGTPLNWGKDLKESMSRVNVGNEDDYITEIAISAKSFSIAANIHAKFWKDDNLVSVPFLRGCDWFSNNGECSWLKAQQSSVDNWKKCKNKISSGESKVNWDTNLIQCMDASFSKISWENYLIDIKNRDFTLVHGDFHPANMMLKRLSPSVDDWTLILLDWEVVGIGSGPQDLAQYLISHMNYKTREGCERALLRRYWDELKEKGGEKLSNYTFENCNKDYIDGGIGRWVWLLSLLTSICPDNITQYFHDQVLHFINTHEITPENIVMPRV
jgi:hypothetical protein